MKKKTFLLSIIEGNYLGDYCIIGGWMRTHFKMDEVICPPPVKYWQPGSDMQGGRAEQSIKNRKYRSDT